MFNRPSEELAQEKKKKDLQTSHTKTDTIKGIIFPNFWFRKIHSFHLLTEQTLQKNNTLRQHFSVISGY